MATMPAPWPADGFPLDAALSKHDAVHPASSRKSSRKKNNDSDCDLVPNIIAFTGSNNNAELRPSVNERSTDRPTEAVSWVMALPKDHVLLQWRLLSHAS